MTATIEPITNQFVIRPLVPADIPAIVAMHAEAEAREPVGDYLTVSEYQEWLSGPFGKGAVVTVAFAAKADRSEGKLVGELVVEKDERNEFAWADTLVHPDYRQRGLGSALYDMALADARKRGATELRIHPNQKHLMGIDFLARRGHQPERYFWDMRLPAETAVAEQPQLPPGFTVRTFVRGQDEQAFMEARNASFAEHYASVPRTLDEIIALTNFSYFDPAGLFLAFAENGEVAGLCWTTIDRDEIAARGEEVGWINTLGVVPAYQRHGLGRALLLIGVQHLRQQVPIVELGVEGKNRKALPLYESVGFRQYRGYVHMNRSLTDTRESK